MVDGFIRPLQFNILFRKRILRLALNYLRIGSVGRLVNEIEPFLKKSTTHAPNVTSDLKTHKNFLQ
jgi:hypothetical protein